MQKRGSTTPVGDAGPPPRPDQRNVLNLWLTVIATVVTVSAAAGGAVHYYESKVCELKIERLTQDHVKRESDAKVLYEERLRSVRFGLGAREQYFDVAKLLIGPSDVYSLPSNARQYQLTRDIDFYVTDYPGGDWTFERTNEFDFTVSVVGESQAAAEVGDMGLIDELKLAELFIFRSPRSFTLQLRDRRRSAEVAPSLNFFPVIAVQPIEHAAVLDAMGIARKQKEIEHLLRQRTIGGSPLMHATTETKIAAALGAMYRADFAGKVLGSIISENFQYMTDYDDVEYRLVAVQKLENVVFLQGVVRFNHFQTADEGSRAALELHEIVVFVNGPYRSVLIRAWIPSLAGQNTEDFDWLRRWLA